MPASKDEIRIPIEPSTAKVWVNGQLAVVQDGGVTVSGSPGESFKVKLQDGERETTTEVVVLVDGRTRPNRLKLPDPPKPKPAARPAKGKPTAAKPAPAKTAKPAATAAPKSTGIKPKETW